MRYIQDNIPTYPFSFEIIRRNRKTLAIHIKSGKVEVRAPVRASQKWIYSFIREKSAWIQQQLSEQEEKLQQQLVFTDGATVYFLGRPRTLTVILSRPGKVEITNDRLLIYTPRNSPELLEKYLHRWLLQQAREYMTPRTITIARQLGVKHKLKDVVFRRTKAKWGHCCSDGTIQYNWLTMMAPRKVIDYLIVHECSHLLYMDHSRRFWNTVSRICPDYEAHRAWLEDHGHTFMTRPGNTGK